ncbi:MAG: phage antirepressor KilAC domain-containing protein [Propionibacteriaceae bacterium]|jgi:prophage antirepressor-like protein|nr:phage antirepressor KilAC domain-containing protein [Propionibacteriaceae bacterium]
MSHDILPYEFSFEGTQVRVDNDNGKAWIVLADLCRVLDSSNPAAVASRLDGDEVGLSKVETNAGCRSMLCVSEAGFYAVIARSNSSKAKPFQRWANHEVFPAIRKHGGYLTPATVEQVLSDPDTIIRLATDLKRERENRLRVEAEVVELMPRAEAFDEFLSASGDYSVNEVAKILSRGGVVIGEVRLRNWMLANKWLYRDAAGKPRAYQTQVDCGRLVERAQWHHHPRTGEKVVDAPQVRVTAKGLEALARALSVPLVDAA